MLDSKKVVVVLPAYNAENTLKRTVREIPNVVDEVILVDDSSSDKTKDIAKSLKLNTITHKNNKGYGGNQKTCYKEALKTNAEVIVMVHPDYQYSPKLITSLAAMISSGHYDIALGSRILGDQRTRRNSMPKWRYISNRLLTWFQNMVLRYKLTEYHTGFRAYSRNFLSNINFEGFSNDFTFDNELILLAIYKDFKIGEISCPTRYFSDSSSINLTKSIKYGFGVVITTLKFVLARHLGIFIKPFSQKKPAT
jgi:glycosyltransferase involved in cell wall biosynthesis